MTGSIISLFQTIDHDVELEIVAVLNKYREEKAENQNKYGQVVCDIQTIGDMFQPMIESNDWVYRYSSIVDGICDKTRYYIEESRFVGVIYQAPGYDILTPFMSDFMQEAWSQRNIISERDMVYNHIQFRYHHKPMLDKGATSIQRFVRGYLVRRHVKWGLRYMSYRNQFSLELEFKAIIIQRTIRRYLVCRCPTPFIFDEGDFPSLARISTQ